MAELIGLGLGCTGTNTVGLPDFNQIFNVFLAYISNQASNRAFGNFADIVIEKMPSDQFSDFICLVFGQFQTIKNLSSHSDSNNLVSIKSGISTLPSFCSGFADIMQQRSQPYFGGIIFIAGILQSTDIVFPDSINMMEVLFHSDSFKDFR